MKKHVSCKKKDSVYIEIRGKFDFKTNKESFSLDKGRTWYTQVGGEMGAFKKKS